MADPLSEVSLGIWLNPRGYASLENYTIQSADLFDTWTSGSLEVISQACNWATTGPDIKEAFHVIISSLNLWLLEHCRKDGRTPSLSLWRSQYQVSWFLRTSGINTTNL
jgi:hypothetical protein